MNRVITAYCADETIKKSSALAGAAGSHNAVTLRLSFSEAWENTTKKVYFFDARGGNPVCVLCTTDRLVPGEIDMYDIMIPGEALAFAGKMSVTVRGVVLDESGEAAERIMMSATTGLEVLDAEVPDADNAPIEPTPTQAEQLQAEIDEIKENIVEAVESAEAAARSAGEALVSANRAAENAEASSIARTGAEDARDIAINAKDAAETARGATEAARDTAVEKAGDAAPAANAAQTAQAGAETAHDGAETARKGAEDAKETAESSARSAEAAQAEAEAAAADALGAAASAALSATAAGDAAEAAEISAGNAQGSAVEAQAAKTAAETARALAETARAAAELAAGNAQTARTAAEIARAAAEAARDTSVSSATAAQASAAAAEAAKTASEAARNAAQAAQSAAAASAAAALISEGKAAISATDAEAWAVGQRGGVDVGTGDPTWHNNAKWYKDQAAAIVGGDYATKAEAQGYANVARDAAISAASADATAKANGALSSANTYTSNAFVAHNASGTAHGDIRGLVTAEADTRAAADSALAANKAELLIFSNKSVAPGAWTSNATYPGFGYRAAVPCTGVTEGMIPSVTLAPVNAISGIFAPVSDSYAGGVYIYASEIPGAAITIPTITAATGKAVS